MNVRIEKNFTFQAAIHFEGTFMVNTYDMTLLMTVLTEDQLEQNIAIERINFYIIENLEHSIFVDSKQKKAIEKYRKAGMKVIELPEEPYDQIIGIVLMLKFDAIMEGRVSLDETVFGSKLTSNIKFHTLFEEAEALYAGNNWWNNNSCAITTKKEKVVKLFDTTDWKDVGLTWQAN